MKQILYILVFLCMGCNPFTKKAEIRIDDLPQDQIAFQKILIGQLSGETSIHTGEGQELYIHSRWTRKERELARRYLEAVIEKLGLSPSQHTVPTSQYECRD